MDSIKITHEVRIDKKDTAFHLGTKTKEYFIGKQQWRRKKTNIADKIHCEKRGSNLVHSESFRAKF